MIKKMVLIAAMGAIGLLWGSGDVTIQVINAVKEKSITHDFEKKLEKSGLAVHKVVEGGRYIVTLGSYKDEKSAQAALKKARTVVCAGAFIRPVKRDQVAMTSHESTKSCKVIATTHEMAKVETPVASHNESKEAMAAVVPKTEHVVVVEVKPVIVEVKNTPVTAAPVVSPAEKKEAYRNEISEAISYYKNSPYHRFEPVMLQH
ncbi:MAG: SPOR domain-containing protein [Sulfuricurvum sp.]|nr:SPOR domain-containing protein [Sulfuricurvum sp.]